VLSSPAQVEVPQTPHVDPAGSACPGKGVVSVGPAAVGDGPVLPSAGSTVEHGRW